MIPVVTAKNTGNERVKVVSISPLSFVKKID